MLAHQKCIHYGLMVIVLTGVSVDSSHLYGQSSFLEKLEAAVRDRLLDPNQPSDNSQAAEQATEEELPSPQATGEPASNRPAPTVSVLEGNSSSPLSAGQTVPAPMASSNDTASAVRRIYLGLEAEEITGGGIGVRVTKVSEGSPAWKAGFRTGDRISGINGFAIANLDTMVERLGKTAPGETVKFLINRDDRNLELVAVLMDAELAGRIAGGPLAIGAQTIPNSGSSVDLSANEGPAGSTPWLGVVVNDLTPEFRKQFGLTVFRGAAVTSVAAESPVSKIGMLAGDAIIAIAGTPIETARDLTVWMSSARPGQKVEITYQRGTAARTSTLTLEVTPESRAANRAPLPEPARSRPNRSAAASAEPVMEAAGESPLNLANSSPTLPAPMTERRPPLTGPAVPRVSDVVPNAIPTPNVPAASGVATSESSNAEVAELRREVARLQAELEKANQRLESTQNRLQKIIEGLGKE